MAPSATVLPLDWNDPSGLQGRTFDTVVAADTLWMSELHIPFCRTIHIALRGTEHAQAHLLAGLHTGRYTIQRFLETAQSEGLVITKLVEHHISGNRRREWAVERPDENTTERARWLVYIRLSL
jgi:EEF1A N-terminal glycine/lysine methyltransferase